MALDSKLLEILVCPQCKGEISAVDGGLALVCPRCKLKFPVRDGIPAMLLEEAVDLRTGARGPEGQAVRLPRSTFRVTAGPDTNMTFQVEQGTCRAIGRGAVDPNRTAVFNVDLALALDEGARSLILQYIGRQFRKAGGKPAANQGERLGHFRRASDVTLTDSSLSRLHSMVFAEESGVGILDLVSKNGTYVNGREVESILLKRGDAIEMGETTIVFEG